MTWSYHNVRQNYKYLRVGHFLHRHRLTIRCCHFDLPRISVCYHSTHFLVTLLRNDCFDFTLQLNLSTLANCLPCVCYHHCICPKGQSHIVLVTWEVEILLVVLHATVAIVKISKKLLGGQFLSLITGYHGVLHRNTTTSQGYNLQIHLMILIIIMFQVPWVLILVLLVMMREVCCIGW